MQDSALIEFRNVTKHFGNQMILDRVNLKIYQGHVTTIIGKSGTGKSVLLKHIIGLLIPDEGTISFRGKPIEEMSQRERNEYLGQISYMFQNNALFDSMTVFENIALPLRQTTHLSKKEIENRVMARIEQTELTDVAHKYPAEISGGMQKRAALGRALVTDPEIVLFDEPTTGQDMIRRNAILSMIAEYQRRFGFTAVLISHDLPDVFFISNRVIAMDKGRIVFQGTPEELDDFQHPFVDEFVASIEGFQDHLTGLHSKRDFKVRYQKALGRKRLEEGFTLAVFSIDNLGVLSENLGYEKGLEVVRSLGEYINAHFGGMGGFSTRLGRDLFVTVLPFSDLTEAEQILSDFSRDLNERGLGRIGTQAAIHGDSCFEFLVTAGLAEGKWGEDINAIVTGAGSRQETIARFQCDTRR